MVQIESETDTEPDLVAPAAHELREAHPAAGGGVLASFSGT